MRRTILAGVILSVALVGCASVGGRSPAATTAATPTGTQAASSTADASRLTRAEIDSADLPNAYELVTRLRRPWLRRAGAVGGDVAVYMDEQNLGGAEKLRDIPATEVAELQYVENADAIRRWGSGTTGAVIVVVRRR